MMNAEELEILREKEKKLLESINLLIRKRLSKEANQRISDRKTIVSGEFFRSGQMHYLAGRYVEAISNEDLTIEERIETLEVVYEALQEEEPGIENR